MHRSFKISNDVYAAMMARGFTGAMRSYRSYRMTANDWLALLIAGCLAGIVFFLMRYP
jgi:energy-coupling factor transporter transmembrane protein EcfT